MGQGRGRGAQTLRRCPGAAGQRPPSLAPWATCGSPGRAFAGQLTPSNVAVLPAQGPWVLPSSAGSRLSHRPAGPLTTWAVKNGACQCVNCVSGGGQAELAQLHKPHAFTGTVHGRGILKKLCCCSSHRRSSVCCSRGVCLRLSVRRVTLYSHMSSNKNRACFQFSTVTRKCLIKLGCC